MQSNFASGIIVEDAGTFHPETSSGLLILLVLVQPLPEAAVCVRAYSRYQVCTRGDAGVLEKMKK